MQRADRWHYFERCEPRRRPGEGEAPSEPVLALGSHGSSPWGDETRVRSEPQHAADTGRFSCAGCPAPSPALRASSPPRRGGSNAWSLARALHQRQVVAHSSCAGCPAPSPALRASSPPGRGGSKAWSFARALHQRQVVALSLPGEGRGEGSAITPQRSRWRDKGDKHPAPIPFERRLHRPGGPGASPLVSPSWATQWLTALALLLSSAAPARAEGLALIVGVNECPEFRLPDGARPRPLQGAENDTDALADLLIGQFGFAGKNVVVLKGPGATREKIKAAFLNLAGRTRAEDQFLFHFSGHGTQIADVQPFDEPDGRDEALCPWDATAFGANLIRDDELGFWLDDLRTRRVTVILDCCHAGTGTKDVDSDPEIASRFLPMKLAEQRPARAKRPWRELQGNTKGFGTQTASFFACQPDQEAYERRFLDRQPPRRAGQFSHFFLEGLRDAAADQNRDGIVSNGELLRFVSRRLDESFNRGRSSPAAHQNAAIETSFPDAPVLAADRSRSK